MAAKQSKDGQGTPILIGQDPVREINIVRQIAETSGPCAVFKYIKGSINRWENEQVTFAITGRASTGKSTFINTIRNLKPGDDGFAMAGSGNTTIIPTLYKHPKNDRIAFCDLPCYSTTKFRKQDYISEMNISDYEFFLIFFDSVLGEDDVWFVNILRKLGKPFCLVRSKIDIDIESAIHNGKDQEMIIREINKNNENALDDSPELKDAEHIFLISSRKPDLGQMSDLLGYIEDNIGMLKTQAVLSSLESVTKEIVENKYKMLKKSLLSVTFLASGVFGEDADSNTSRLESEVHHYMHEFGFNRAGVDSLIHFNQSLLRCRSLLEPNLNMETFVAEGMASYPTPVKVPSVNDFFLSFTGHMINSGVIGMAIYLFLDNLLDNINHDAVLIYEYVLKTNAYH